MALPRQAVLLWTGAIIITAPYVFYTVILGLLTSPLIQRQ